MVVSIILLTINLLLSLSFMTYGVLVVFDVVPELSMKWLTFGVCFFWASQFVPRKES